MINIVNGESALISKERIWEKTEDIMVRKSQRRKNESNTGVKHTGTIRATNQ